MVSFLSRLLGRGHAAAASAERLPRAGAYSDRDMVEEVHLDSIVGGLARSFVYDAAEEGPNDFLPRF
jgi:hypothetical protein